MVNYNSAIYVKKLHGPRYYAPLGDDKKHSIVVFVLLRGQGWIVQVQHKLIEQGGVFLWRHG
jgi:hypothetical protein